MTTSEKVAYLKGLAEGYGMDSATKEGKLLSTVLDILEDLALDVEDLTQNIGELEEGLDAVSDDLADVEDILFDEEDDDADEDEYDEEDDDTLFYEATCPACGEIITFDENALAHGDIRCPACGAELELDPDGGAEDNGEGDE